MELNIKVKAVRVYNDNDSALRYRLQLDEAIDAIVRDSVTGEYVDAKVDYIDFLPRVLIAQMLNHVVGLDLMYTKKKEEGLRNGIASGFGAAELQAVLRNAVVTIERTKFEVGSEYTTSDGEVKTHEHAGYNTAITAVKVSELVQSKLDALLDKMFDL